MNSLATLLSRQAPPPSNQKPVVAARGLHLAPDRSTEETRVVDRVRDFRRVLNQQATPDRLIHPRRHDQNNRQ